MANYVEQATLKLNDQTSAPARNINASLRRLYNTAKQLQDLSGKSAGLNALVRDLQKASRVASRLPTIKLRVDSSQVQRAITRLNQLSVATGSVNSVQTVVRGQAGARGRGSVPSVPLGAGGGGLGLGNLRSSIVATTLAFRAVNEAVNLTASALRSIADNATLSSRVQLQASVAASQEQRDIFAASDKALPRADDRLRLPDNVFNQLRTSLLGDVQGSASQRALGADRLARAVERDLVAPIIAMNPEADIAQVTKGMRGFVKAMNLASTDMMDAAGNFSKDGQRVWKGVQLALRINPELTGQFARTTIANAKTAGFTLSEEGIARLLTTAGDRGVRSSNELFQSIKAFDGTIRNAALNNSLANENLLQGAQFDRRGNVVPGSGRAVDEELRRRDPAQWLQKHVRPIIERKAREMFGPSADVTNPVVFTSALNKTFPGMRETGQQGIADLMLGFEQMNASLQQGMLSQQQNITKAVQENWSAAALNVQSAWSDAASRLGDALAKGLGLGDILKNIERTLRGEWGATAVGGAVAAGGVAGLGGLVGIGSLVTAGPALNTAAANLTLAAGALGRSAGVSSIGGAAAGAAGGGIASIARMGLRFGGPLAVGGILAWDYANNGPIYQAAKEIGATITGTKTSQPTNTNLPLAELNSELAGLRNQKESRQAELDQLNRDIASAKARQQQTGLFDPNLQRNEGQAQQVRNEMTMLDEKIATFEASVASAKAAIAQGIGEGGTSAGANAAAALINQAGAIGDTIGDRAAARINQARPRTPVMTMPPNTGAVTPTE